MPEINSGRAGGEAMLGNARASLLARLRELGTEVSVADLAEVLGMHRNTVARHLDALVVSGLVARRADSGGRRGRPVGLYRATTGHSTGQEFASLVRRLTLELSATGITVDEAEKIGQAWADDIVAREKQSEGPARSCFEILADMGFEPHVSDDRRSLELYQCPMLGPEEYDETVCHLHTAMVKRLLEADGVDASKYEVTPFRNGGACWATLGGDVSIPQHGGVIL